MHTRRKLCCVCSCTIIIYKSLQGKDKLNLPKKFHVIFKEERTLLLVLKIAISISILYTPKHTCMHVVFISLQLFISFWVNCCVSTCGVHDFWIPCFVFVCLIVSFVDNLFLLVIIIWYDDVQVLHDQILWRLQFYIYLFSNIREIIMEFLIS